MKEDDLTRRALTLFEAKFPVSGVFSLSGDRILITVCQTDYETKHGELIVSLQRIIDEHMESRSEDIQIILTDGSHKNRHVIKIWNTLL